MASDKLPCLFCTAEGRETSETDTDYPSKRFMFIQCTRCGARTASIYGTGDPSEWADARSNWNTRITSPAATDAQGVGEAPKAVAMPDSIEVARLWEIFRTSDEGQRSIEYLTDRAIMPHLSTVHGALFLAYRAGLYTHPAASTTAGLTEAARLTDTQIEEGRRETFSTDNPYCPCDSKTMRKAARWAERACAEKWNVRLDGGTAE